VTGVGNSVGQGSRRSHSPARGALGEHSTVAAPSLLGSILHGPHGSGRIVEVEAYGGAEDAASHASRGLTPRTEPMFGPAGVLYVYLIYGMHHCANVVTGPEGYGQAVLIRGVEPLEITPAMRAARPKAKTDVELTNGPGKLCAALGIDLDDDGRNLLDWTSPVRLELREPVDEAQLATSTRIGINVARERPWRWYITANKFVSRGKPAVP